MTSWTSAWRLQDRQVIRTQLWHITTKPDGNVTLNKSGGRAAEIWTGNATQGQQIGQWVDNATNGLFKMVTKSNGYVYFQSVQNPSLYLTGSSAGATLTLKPSDNGVGSQDWQLVAK
ncbi:RICIN domain-containing protein [Microbacterium sp. X-17]|uniref:RICIN domain-containing protein n=1 Tax=Microbacterium sp. X-17 TaxID=3144404 RepID=UPI0031F48459